MSDWHGNEIAEEGCDRCFCGCKYWEMDRCIDCKTHVSVAKQLEALPEGTNIQWDRYKPEPRLRLLPRTREEALADAGLGDHAPDEVERALERAARSSDGGFSPVEATWWANGSCVSVAFYKPSEQDRAERRERMEEVLVKAGLLNVRESDMACKPSLEMIALTEDNMAKLLELAGLLKA